MDYFDELRSALIKRVEELSEKAVERIKQQEEEIKDLTVYCFELEQLCKDLYLVAREGYIGESLHNRLVELGFAEGSE